MRIETYLNTTKEEVESKTHNIWIGISLGNKYFTPEHIKAYIEWALEHTKDDVLVLFVDSLHKHNLETFSDKSEGAALRKAMKESALLQKQTKELLSEEQLKLAHFVGWDDIARGDIYRHNLESTFEEFKKRRNFYGDILHNIKMLRSDKKKKIESLSVERLDNLARYILSEVALFINPLCYKNKRYAITIYPSLSKIDEIVIGLNKKQVYPNLSSKLSVEESVGIVFGKI